MSALIGKSLDTVVNSMNMDAIIDHVDVDRIVERIDVDRVIQRVDLNAVLGKIDLDRLIQRIDVNAIVDRVDINEVLERSNLEAIIARSSASLLTQVVDLVRVSMVKLDLFVFRMSRCRCLYRQLKLPPLPWQEPTPAAATATATDDPLAAPAVQVQPERTPRRGDLKRHPTKRFHKVRAVDIQGRYSGVISRGISWVIDEGIAIVSFAILVMMTESLIQLMIEDDNYEIHPGIGALLFVLWSALLRTLGLLMTHRTLGMFLVGIVLVNTRGQRPTTPQILWRQSMQPFVANIPMINIIFFVSAWIRNDGRFPHDILSCTGCVYTWDVRMAKLRMRHKRQQERLLSAYEKKASSRHNTSDGEEEDDEDDDDDEEIFGSMFP